MPYPASFMYEVVNDVQAYPEFLPWCGGVKIHQSDSTTMEASILMKKSKLNHWFKTRNRMLPGRSIEMTLVEGPFKTLEGFWRFTPLEPAASKIELELSFEMTKGLTSAIIAPAFTQIANTMVDSFCSRAQELHDQ